MVNVWDACITIAGNWIHPVLHEWIAKYVWTWKALIGKLSSVSGWAGFPHIDHPCSDSTYEVKILCITFFFNLMLADDWKRTCANTLTCTTRLAFNLIWEREINTHSEYSILSMSWQMCTVSLLQIQLKDMFRLLSKCLRTKQEIIHFSKCRNDYKMTSCLPAITCLTTHIISPKNNKIIIFI